ncbi:hypothetical protein ABEV77_04125 [Bacillus subtilis]
MKIDLNAMGYDELMAHGDAVMEAIKKRTFQEGFRAAKQVQRKLAKMNAEKSAQARRDEIVEQAKADVAMFCSDLFAPDVEFIVNRKKRTVVALLRGCMSGNVQERGIAKAAPSDCFNVHIGKAIALRRALGSAVPDEYLNAPQPTEVRVGDVIMPSVLKKNTPRKVVATDVEVDAIANVCCLDSIMATNNATIIDDSREEVIGE